jgi:hypothetical protein
LDVKSRVGEKSGQFSEEISRERIHRFAESIGAPVSDEAPPTFLTVLRKSEFALFDQLGIPLSKVLHAEQEYTFDVPIKAGDRVAFETILSKALVKTGNSGTMSFMTFKTDFRVGDRPVATSSTVIVVKT